MLHVLCFQMDAIFKDKGSKFKDHYEKCAVTELKYVFNNNNNSSSNNNNNNNINNINKNKNKNNNNSNENNKENKENI